MQTLLINDETAVGKILNQISLEVESETITVKELIMLRVNYEVEVYNQKLPDYFSGLVQPTEAERVLNGYKMREKRQIDAEKQCYIALKAFQENGYFILIDNHQAENLDKNILVTSDTTISFVKLTPLVGG